MLASTTISTIEGDRSRPDGGLYRLVDRRTFVATGGVAATALLAGCIAGDDGEPNDENGTDEDGGDEVGDGKDSGGDGGGSGESGTFRLLVSDRPAAIDDFDSLAVSFDHARVFPQGDEEDGEGENDDEGEDDGESKDEGDGEDESDGEDGEGDDGQEGSPGNDNGEGNGNGRGSGSGAEDGDEKGDGGDDGSGDGGDRGWRILDLDGATVDLTEVVGDRATPVFEGELEAGRYAKVELHVSDVEGVVDGDGVDVKVPSEKLQIVHPFEVRAGEGVSFVFDVNVVEKGNGGYNLTPVISESGVAGEDVEVEEVDGEEGKESEDGEEGEESEDGESEGNDENDEDEEGGGNGEGDGEGDGEDGSGDSENGG